MPENLRTHPEPNLMEAIAVIDFETDPFEHGIVPRPFAAGFYDGSRYLQFWGDDCAVEEY